jgi:hypothetical protein
VASLRFRVENFATFARIEPVSKNAKVAHRFRAQNGEKRRKTPPRNRLPGVHARRLLQRFNGAPRAGAQKQNSLERGGGQGKRLDGYRTEKAGPSRAFRELPLNLALYVRKERRILAAVRRVKSKDFKQFECVDANQLKKLSRTERDRRK